MNDAAAKPTAPTTKADRDYIYGLDTIRLICAAVVAIGHHYTVLELTGSPASDRIINFLFGLLWNGPAAVIVFFVISGFVIHYPYRQGKPFRTVEFYVKRSVRIILPCAAFMLILAAVNGQMIFQISWNETVLWSLICELIYYALYPLIVLSGVRINRLLGFSVLGWIILVAMDFDGLATNKNYTAPGYWTFVAGLPCWLLGCWLAENLSGFRCPGTLRLNLWRAAAFGVPMVIQIICNQYPGAGAFGSYTILLNLYAPVCAIWLGYELRAFAGVGRPLVTDRWGQATFSLYLVHSPLMVHWPFYRGVGSLLLYGALVAVATWLFYVLFERPSHLLARNLGNRFR